mgnify:CR=1 FL=1
MMVWDQQVGRYSLFGENRSMKDYKKRVESGCNSCYIVFDCLWLNGENLSGLPLSERRRRLEGAVLWEPDKHTIMLNELTEIDDGKVSTDGSSIASKSSRSVPLKDRLRPLNGTLILPQSIRWGSASEGGLRGDARKASARQAKAKSEVNVQTGKAKNDGEDQTEEDKDNKKDISKAKEAGEAQERPEETPFSMLLKFALTSFPSGWTI